MVSEIDKFRQDKSLIDRVNSKMTDVYEGSLIRMFRRLEELLLQMIAAAKVMGSQELEEKFTESLSKIKRGKCKSESCIISRISS